MTQRFTSSLAVVALAAALACPATAKEETSEGEAELAEILEGYEAGEPVKCLRASGHDNLQIVDDTAMVFRDGRTLYVNRTSAPRFLDSFDLPVFRLFGSSRLCRLDQVEMRDRLGGFPGPILTLESFVPYTKKSANADAG